MLFVIEAKDKTNALELRLKTRSEHLKYLDELGDDLILAGPFLDENEKPCGSMLIVNANNIESANLIAKNDPYAKVGLFASTSVKAWLWAIKKPKRLE